MFQKLKNRIEKFKKESDSVAILESSSEMKEYVNKFINFPGLQKEASCGLSFAERCRFVLKGCALGDYAGQPYEAESLLECKYLKKDDLYQESIDITEDTVLACATADVILNNLKSNTKKRFDETYKFYAKEYTHPLGGYGARFLAWVYTGVDPNSCGNGAAMRVGSCGCFDKIEDVVSMAYESAVCTHHHQEGIKGAIVTAVCIWMAFYGYSKEDIGSYCAFHYQGSPYSPAYDFETLLSYKETKGSPAVCQTTVPMAVSCFVNSESYEDCILKAIQFGWDTDTQASVAGSIAAAYYQSFSEESNKIYEKLKQNPYIKNILKLTE